MPLSTINEQKKTQKAKTGKQKKWPDHAPFDVAGWESTKLIHHWTDDEQRAQTTEIHGRITAADLRAVKFDIEDGLQRGMIIPAKVMVDAEPE